MVKKQKLGAAAFVLLLHLILAFVLYRQIPTKTLKVKFTLRDASGAEHAWAWDGRNDQGMPVSSGVYTVRLMHHEVGSSLLVKSESVTLLQLPSASPKAALASALMAPNPLQGSQSNGEAVLFWKPAPRTSGLARLYSLAGELVAVGADANGSGQLRLPVRNLSGGIYLVEFEVLEGQAVLGRRALKLAVVQ
jgi:hypothetical protein